MSERAEKFLREWYAKHPPPSDDDPEKEAKVFGIGLELFQAALDSGIEMDELMAAGKELTRKFLIERGEPSPF